MLTSAQACSVSSMGNEFIMVKTHFALSIIIDTALDRVGNHLSFLVGGRVKEEEGAGKGGADPGRGGGGGGGGGGVRSVVTKCLFNRTKVVPATCGSSFNDRTFVVTTVLFTTSQFPTAFIVRLKRPIPQSRYSSRLFLTYENNCRCRCPCRFCLFVFLTRKAA